MCVLAKTTKKKKNSHRRDRVHYAVSDTTPTLLVGTQKDGFVLRMFVGGQ